MTDAMTVAVQLRQCNCKYKKYYYKYSLYNTLNTDNKQGLHNTQARKQSITAQNYYIDAFNQHTGITVIFQPK